MWYFLIGFALMISGEVASAQPDYSTSQYCSPWCLSFRSGGEDCSYNTFEQCRASQSSWRHLRAKPVPEQVRAESSAAATSLIVA